MEDMIESDINTAEHIVKFSRHPLGDSELTQTGKRRRLQVSDSGAVIYCCFDFDSIFSETTLSLTQKALLVDRARDVHPVIPRPEFQLPVPPPSPHHHTSPSRVRGGVKYTALYADAIGSQARCLRPLNRDRRR